MPRRDGGEVRNSLTANATTVVQAGHLHGGVHFHHHQQTPLRAVQLELAAAVHSQWRDEALRRGLLDHHPLRVPWAAAHWSLADHGDDIAGGFSGNHGSPNRLAASFRTLSRRRLVVLGEGGSGKTALTLLLVLGLLNDLRADEPVPVPMSIASWDPHQEHLLAWLARRLQAEYPGIRRYGGAVAEQLVTERRVMPVLDNLDEAPLRWQGSALMELNQSLTIDDPLVLTCRTDNYAQAVQCGDVLRTAAVVQAQPVPRQAVIDHLHRATPPHRTSQWAPVFEQLADRAATPVAQALTSPLIISLARTVYTRSHVAPAELLDRSRFPNREAIENYLLNALIQAVYQNSPAPPAPGRRRQPGARYELHKATKWAVFLAQHTYRLGTRDIAWWDFKHTTPRTVYALAAWLTSALFLACPWILLAVHVPSPTDIYTQYAVIFSLLSLAIAIRAAYRARKPKPPIQTMLASSAKPFEVIKYGAALDPVQLLLPRSRLSAAAWSLRHLRTGCLVLGAADLRNSEDVLGNCFPEPARAYRPCRNLQPEPDTAQRPDGEPTDAPVLRHGGVPASVACPGLRAHDGRRVDRPSCWDHPRSYRNSVRNRFCPRFGLVAFRRREVMARFPRAPTRATYALPHRCPGTGTAQTSRCGPPVPPRTSARQPAALPVNKALGIDPGKVFDLALPVGQARPRGARPS